MIGIVVIITVVIGKVVVTARTVTAMTAAVAATSVPRNNSIESRDSKRRLPRQLSKSCEVQEYSPLLHYGF